MGHVDSCEKMLSCSCLMCLGKFNYAIGPTDRKGMGSGTQVACLVRGVDLGAWFLVLPMLCRMFTCYQYSIRVSMTRLGRVLLSLD